MNENLKMHLFYKLSWSIGKKYFLEMYIYCFQIFPVFQCPSCGFASSFRIHSHQAPLYCHLSGNSPNLIFFLSNIFILFMIFLFPFQPSLSIIFATTMGLHLFLLADLCMASSYKHWLEKCSWDFKKRTNVNQLYVKPFNGLKGILLLAPSSIFSSFFFFLISILWRSSLFLSSRLSNTLRMALAIIFERYTRLV